MNEIDIEEIDIERTTANVFKVNMEPVGIGKFIVRVSKKPWHIPHLHFNVYQCADLYYCTNLELGLDGYGKSYSEAITSMISVVLEHLNTNVEDNDGYMRMTESVDNHAMDDLWRQYRMTEFKLAFHKKDIGHAMVEKYEQIIDSLRREMYRKDALFTPESLNYEPLTRAA